jgi:pantoate--beta-alanine ligase
MGLLQSETATRELVVVGHVDELRFEVASARKLDSSIAVVPTMGALHAGHLSLVQTAREECDFVVVTNFVNPEQFGPNEDFETYPRTLDADLNACRKLGVDLMFHPTRETIYPDDFSTFVEVKGLSDVLEGKSRPSHFRGVTTVVIKLLNLVQPDVAYFGRKDYQQQLLIRKMCRDLNVPVEICICPTVREPDGLALSSRNRYLSSAQRRSALSLSQCLLRAKNRLLAGETDVSAIRAEMQKTLESTPDVRVDYATVAHPETLEELSTPLSSMIALVAARVGESRLIDNLPIRL